MASGDHAVGDSLPDGTSGLSISAEFVAATALEGQHRGGGLQQASWGSPQQLLQQASLEGEDSEGDLRQHSPLPPPPLRPLDNPLFGSSLPGSADLSTLLPLGSAAAAVASAPAGPQQWEREEPEVERRLPHMPPAPLQLPHLPGPPPPLMMMHSPQLSAGGSLMHSLGSGFGGECEGALGGSSSQLMDDASAQSRRSRCSVLKPLLPCCNQCRRTGAGLGGGGGAVPERKPGGLAAAAAGPAAARGAAAAAERRPRPHAHLDWRPGQRAGWQARQPSGCAPQQPDRRCCFHGGGSGGASPAAAAVSTAALPDVERQPRPGCHLGR